MNSLKRKNDVTCDKNGKTNQRDKRERGESKESGKHSIGAFPTLFLFIIFRCCVLPSRLFADISQYTSVYIKYMSVYGIRGF